MTGGASQPPRCSLHVGALFGQVDVAEWPFKKIIRLLKLEGGKTLTFRVRTTVEAKRGSRKKAAMPGASKSLLAHVIIEGPPSVVMLLSPAALFPEIAGNEAATMMARGVGGALFALTLLAWRVRGMAPSRASQAVVESLLVYHVLALCIVFLCKTAHGEAKAMEYLSNAVHAGMAIALWWSR